jgi:hypothetical protein
MNIIPHKKKDKNFINTFQSVKNKIQTVSSSKKIIDNLNDNDNDNKSVDIRSSKLKYKYPVSGRGSSTVTPEKTKIKKVNSTTNKKDVSFILRKKDEKKKGEYLRDFDDDIDQF